MPSYPVTIDSSFVTSGDGTSETRISALSVRYAPETESLARDTLNLSLAPDSSAPGDRTKVADYTITSKDSPAGQEARAVSRDAKEIECVLCWDDDKEGYVLMPLTQNVRVSHTEPRKAPARMVHAKALNGTGGSGSVGNGSSSSSSSSNGSGNSPGSGTSTSNGVSSGRRIPAGTSSTQALRRARPIAPALSTSQVSAKRTGTQISDPLRPAPPSKGDSSRMSSSNSKSNVLTVDGQTRTKVVNSRRSKATSYSSPSNTTISAESDEDGDDNDDDDDDDDFGDLANELADDLEKASTPQPHLTATSVRALGTAGTALKRNNNYDADSSSSEEE